MQKSVVREKKPDTALTGLEAPDVSFVQLSSRAVLLNANNLTSDFLNLISERSEGPVRHPYSLCSFVKSAIFINKALFIYKNSTFYK